MTRFAKVLLIVSINLIVTIGCHPQNLKTDREKSFRLARQSDTLIRANKLDSAQILIDKALTIYPDNYVAYNNRAYIKSQEKKPEQEIIDDYNKAIELWPKYDIGLFSLANYYFLIYDYKNTIKISSRYLELQLSKNLDRGMVAHIYAIMGISEKRLLQFDNAIIDLKKSIEMIPGDKFSHEELGECYYYGRNDIPSAIVEFTKALDIDSAYFPAYYEREKCERNSKPALIKQAMSDSINAKKFDTSRATKPDTISIAYEKVRKSIKTEISKASAYYDSIIALYRPNKILQQKVIDILTQDFQSIHNDSTVHIDTKYLQKITNDAIKNNQLVLQKINKIQEVDSTINLKKKLLDYENLFRDFMINKVPEVLKLLNQTHEDRFTRGVISVEPILILIKQKGIEFYNAEEALMDKYSLH